MTALRSRTNSNATRIIGRAGSGVMAMGNATAVRGDNSRTPTTVVGNYFSEREAREEFSATIYQFMPRQLAKASGCTIDAAKHWIGARRSPNLASTINMARSLPCVSEWLAEKIGWRAAHAMSADAVIRWAHETRAAAGLDGEVARAVLREVAGAGPEKKPAAPSVDAPAVRDLFERRAA